MTDQASLDQQASAPDSCRVLGSSFLGLVECLKCLSSVVTEPSLEVQTVLVVGHELTQDFLSVDKKRQQKFNL